MVWVVVWVADMAENKEWVRVAWVWVWGVVMENKEWEWAREDIITAADKSLEVEDLVVKAVWEDQADTVKAEWEEWVEWEDKADSKVEEVVSADIMKVVITVVEGLREVRVDLEEVLVVVEGLKAVEVVSKVEEVEEVDGSCVFY